jgi:hypothetical protein
LKGRIGLPGSGTCLAFLVVCVSVFPAPCMARSADRSQEVQVSSLSASAFGGTNSKSVISGRVKVFDDTTFQALGNEAEDVHMILIPRHTTM